ncbi:MAG: BLUF domain-containing protein [Acinetobacter sp.]
MNDIRLLYVSKFKSKINPINELCDILSEALTFNGLNQIYGALYYGNNYFVQCLEGQKDKVEHLFYQKILKDPRHENCEVLSCENIEQYSFSGWHMKYAMIHTEVLEFFAHHHNDEFNPYLLNTVTIPAFINLLSQHGDSFSILKSKALVSANPI